MNYCIEEFKNTFLRVKFDDMLIDQNNDLINSDLHYLDVKNTYLYKTNINCDNLLQLFNEYYKLNNNYCCDHNIGRYTYTYVNSNDSECLNNQIKTILKQQNKIYSEFLHYISFLNIQPQNSDSRNVNIFKIEKSQTSGNKTTKLSSR